MFLKILIAALALLFVAGCQSPVVLKNPKTGKVAQCGPYFVGLSGPVINGAVKREAQCIQDYKEQGFVRQ